MFTLTPVNKKNRSYIKVKKVRPQNVDSLTYYDGDLILEVCLII